MENSTFSIFWEGEREGEGGGWEQKVREEGSRREKKDKFRFKKKTQ